MDSIIQTSAVVLTASLWSRKCGRHDRNDDQPEGSAMPGMSELTTVVPSTVNMLKCGLSPGEKK